MRDNIVFLNNKFIKSSEAVVSIFDSGYFYGDGIYEVALLKDKKIVQIEDHLNRLEKVCKMVDFVYQGHDYFKNIIQGLVNKNPSIHTAIIYIQITRGLKEDRYQPFLKMKDHTVTAYLKEVEIDYDKIQNKKLSSLLMIDNRRLDGNIKMTSLLPSCLARIKAEKEGYDYVIFKSRETGALLEGVTSNLFIVNKNDEILTHPLNHELLAGCVRSKLIEEFAKIGITIHERLYYEEDLLQAKEVFVTGSIKLINAITSVNGNIIANGEVGKITKLALDLYKNVIESSSIYI